MQKHLAVGGGIKILDKNHRWGSTNPPASLRVNVKDLTKSDINYKKTE